LAFAKSEQTPGYCEPVAINRRFWQPPRMTLDTLPANCPARIVAVDWSLLAPEEALRLKALGIDEGAKITIAHRGVFAGSDPIALEIGRMTVALRRSHARAMMVEQVA
jgi:ferrous iron transport protein A